MEKQYHKLLEDILEYGKETKDRTGIGTLSIFGYQSRYNLREGFPAVTTKKLNFRAVSAELLWFLEGSTDERRLAELTYGQPREQLVERSTIWTANAEAQGRALGYECSDLTKELGPVYGSQWRSFGKHLRDSGFDQLEWIINEIRANPTSRRLILSAWAPDRISDMALPPCHYACQFLVRDNRLHCLLNQRSGDSFLGIPYNIASYSLLTHIIARECELEVGDFVHSIGDAHIYTNHIEQVKEQLSREPYHLPRLKIADDFDLMDVFEHGFAFDEASKFELLGYEHHPFIKAPMAV